MKKYIVYALIFSCSMNAGLFDFLSNTEAIGKGRAQKIVASILMQIDEKTQNDADPYDHYKYVFYKNSMARLLTELMASPDIMAIDKSVFETWLNALIQVAQDKQLDRLQIEKPKYTSVHKRTVHSTPLDFSEKAYLASEEYITRALPKIQTKNRSLEDDATLVAGSEESRSEVKGPGSEHHIASSEHKSEKKDTAGCTASDDESELAAELNDDCELVAQLKRNEQQSAFQTFMSKHPLLRAAGLTGAVLIAYKIYLHAQEQDVVMVDNAQNAKKK